MKELLQAGISQESIDRVIEKYGSNSQGGSLTTLDGLGGEGQGCRVGGELAKKLCHLKPRERRFVVLYAETGNASDSARRAGWSSKSGNQVGHLLLQRDDIRKCILLAVQTAGADSAARMLRATDLAREMHARIQDKSLPLPERAHAAKVWTDAEGVLNELGKLSMKVEVSVPRGTSHFTAEDAAVLVAANRIKYANKASQQLPEAL